MLLLSQRYSTQLEELETMKASIQGQQSSHSRNLSNERPLNQQRQLQFSMENPRHKNKVQSYSVEKQLNLSSQNQKVENLIASWMHQKNSQSLNSTQNVFVPSKVINDVRSAQQLENQNKELNKPHIIMEEDALFTEETENQPNIQNNKNNQSKIPVHLIVPTKNHKDIQSQEIKKVNKGKKQYNQRPQTTKINQGNQAKSSPFVFKEQFISNSMKMSQIDQSKLNNQFNGTNTQHNKNKQQYSFKQVKKSSASIHEENLQENQFISDLLRLKEQILSTYLKQNRALIGSQNQIVKYISVIKLEILMKLYLLQSRISQNENIYINIKYYNFTFKIFELIHKFLIFFYFGYLSLK
ncbi:unnamed protein product [Paramecium sonneborni]|uniref:Uncharacterized protein n=1 Tax=Paramecium sonneborni TaxID=65129 RepID=A0A8S1QHT2_9CILI|nr:unnamed protein product [Paramecium sonneborni]